jgi:acyl-CoA thioesterase FadM
MKDMTFYNSKHAARKVYDEEGGQEIYEYIFQPTFKESANLSRSVFFSSYLAWAGKVRELALGDIGEQLVAQIATGEWGLVTNWADLKIINEVYSFENILARFRIGKVFNSIIPLRCEFFKLIKGEKSVPLAVVEQETTWVEVMGHGQVRPAPFPGYLSSYLDHTKQTRELVNSDLSFKDGFLDINKGELLYKAPLVLGEMAIAEEESFLTTQEDSNLVGNVYYANYFIWQGRVRDKFINSFAPEFLRGIGRDGELICVSSRLDYLRDAMPFDKIYVAFSINEVYQTQATLKFEFYRVLPEDKKEKLAIGEHVVRWLIQDKHGKGILVKLPNKIISGLLRGLT